MATVSERWTAALMSFGWGPALERATPQSCVSELKVLRGSFSAVVRDEAVGDVTISVAMPVIREWMAGRVRGEAAKRHWEDPEDPFMAAGTWLIPRTAHEFTNAFCSKDRHAAAVLVAFGEALKSDPELLCVVRGVGRLAKGGASS